MTSLQKTSDAEKAKDIRKLSDKLVKLKVEVKHYGIFYLSFSDMFIRLWLRLPQHNVQYYHTAIILYVLLSIKLVR